MIEALDHISLATSDAAGALADLAAVLGSVPVGQRLQLGNVAVEFDTLARPPVTAGGGVAATEIGLIFAVPELEAATHRLARRALPCGRLGPGRVEIDRAATHGVTIGLIERATLLVELRPVEFRGAASHDILGLDHVVVRTRDPERAVALYGGRLGLDLRLDRTNPERANRLLFFVCGDLVVEISHDTTKGVRPGPDAIWGLAWRSADVHSSRARMNAAGIAVSEIRTGNRPGTEVFTVKSHTAAVPTLVIGGSGLARK